MILSRTWYVLIKIELINTKKTSSIKNILIYDRNNHVIGLGRDLRFENLPLTINLYRKVNKNHKLFSHFSETKNDAEFSYNNSALIITESCGKIKLERLLNLK